MDEVEELKNRVAHLEIVLASSRSVVSALRTELQQANQLYPVVLSLQEKVRRLGGYEAECEELRMDLEQKESQLADLQAERRGVR